MRGKRLLSKMNPFRIPNLLTKDRAGFKNKDIGKWMVGFKPMDDLVLVGIFDHRVEADNSFSNLSGSKDLLAECAWILGKGYACMHMAIYDEKSGAYQEVFFEKPDFQLLRTNFDRWGRNPDDIPDRILFADKLLPDGRLKDCPIEFSDEALKTSMVFVKKEKALLCWAIDGHLYVLTCLSEESVRDKLKLVGNPRHLRLSDYQDLLM